MARKRTTSSKATGKAAAKKPAARKAAAKKPAASKAAAPRAAAKKTSAASPPPASPYGGGGGQGISIPPYFKPTPYLNSNSTFFPTSEEIGPDEMRITFMGSCPFPPKRDQAATCICVELGNGDRFFFDFGPGSLRNILAAQVPLQTINDIFFTHLHVDHYGELPYLFCFAPWAGRWTPLRVHGPSGRTKDEGIGHMIDGMKRMTHWHTKSFNASPIGDGYEVEVNEFDYTDDNGICYDKNGVTVRHWRRSHNMDGASAYRLDWNGLSFVWTGDGRPDTNTVEYAQGVDVFVTELQPDLGATMERKTGIPAAIYNSTIDLVHTDHYATGYMIDQVNPRIGMVTHMAFDRDLVSECLAGIRQHWQGLFCFGAPDGVVVNVTKDAVWTRDWAVSDSANMRSTRSFAPSEFRAMFGGEIPTSFRVPTPQYSKNDLLSAEIQATEIGGPVFTPADVQRHTIEDFSEAFGDLMTTDIPLSALIGAQQFGKAAGDVTHAIRTLTDGAQLLGYGLLGQVVPNAAQAEQAKAALTTITSMVREAAWRSDAVREGAQAAVQEALPALKDAKERHDFKAAAGSMVEVAGTLGAELQKPDVQQMTAQATGLFIDAVSSRLGAKDVQSGKASPTEALQGAAAMSAAMFAGIFGDKLKSRAVAGNVQEAVEGLQGFGGPLLSSGQVKPGIDQFLLIVGQMLQDPGKREALKGAVATLVQTAGTVGGSLQNGNAKEAVTSGAGLIIEGLGSKLQTANATS